MEQPAKELLQELVSVLAVPQATNNGFSLFKCSRVSNLPFVIFQRKTINHSFEFPGAL